MIEVSKVRRRAGHFCYAVKAYGSLACTKFTVSGGVAYVIYIMMNDLESVFVNYLSKGH